MGLKEKDEKMNCSHKQSGNNAKTVGDEGGRMMEWDNT